MSIIASAVVLCLMGPTPAPPRLRVDVHFEGMRMWPRREAAAMQEVARIWSPYGVDVRRSSPSDAAPDGALRVGVVLVDRHDERVPADALASILFSGDSPQPTILVYPNTIEALVARNSSLGLVPPQWPKGFRELILGRALGRVLAHELGHFLLRSRQHSKAGLMQADQAIGDLIDPDRRRYTLSGDDMMRLASVRRTAVGPFAD